MERETPARERKSRNEGPAIQYGSRYVARRPVSGLVRSERTPRRMQVPVSTYPTQWSDRLRPTKRS